MSDTKSSNPDSHITQIANIRSVLKTFVEFEHGKTLREQLKEIAAETYVPKHSPADYFKFLNLNAASFSENHPQSSNHPYVWTMFTVASQHVMGDCIEECLDKALSLKPKPKLIVTG